MQQTDPVLSLPALLLWSEKKLDGEKERECDREEGKARAEEREREGESQEKRW